MKTIRNQLKYPVSLRLPVFPRMEFLERSVYSFYVVTKRTTNRQQTKIS